MSAIVDVWKRELGQLSSRNFAHRLAASEDLVLRLDILRKLDVHRGCVNTVSFNASGDILVSGSDDKKIVLWDWETGQVKLSFHSDHSNNVFQAKFMPYTEDRRIVTCAADGQVRLAQISECTVVTKLLAEHQGRVHKLAIEPGSPHILYTCGEDGLVQHIDMRTESATSLFTCKPVPSQMFFHAVHLNAITIDPRNPNLFAVGGLDPFARLYDIRRYKWDGSSDFGRPVDVFCPMHLTDDENVGITGLTFSDQSELLVSYNDEFIYLFTKDLGLDQSDAGNMTLDKIPGSSLSNVDGGVEAAPQSYKGHMNSETVKGAGFFGPKCEYVVSGSDCGRIFIWNKKGGRLVRVMEADKHVVNCIEPHPHSTVLASSGIEHDIKMWIPKAIDRAILPTNIQKDRAVSLRRQGFSLFPFRGFYDRDEDDDFFFLADNDEDDEDEYEDEEDDDCDITSGSDDDDDDDDDGDNDDEDEYEDEEDDDCDITSGSDDDDDDDDDGDNDDDEEEEEEGNCDNTNNIAENYDDQRRNEIPNEQFEGEKNNDDTDFNSVGNSDDCSSDTSIYNEMDDISGFDNDVNTVHAASDDSLLDSRDINNCSDFDCSDSDFDD